MLDLYYNLKDKYEITTRNYNHFLHALNRVKWDHQFYADGEYYFIKDDLTLMVQDLDPFNQKWCPTAIFKDGLFLSFE